MSLTRGFMRIRERESLAQIISQTARQDVIRLQPDQPEPERDIMVEERFQLGHEVIL